MQHFQRTFFGCWSLLFLLFAYWQWNDPDPTLWVSIYGFAALMAGTAAAGRFPMPVLITVFFLGLAGFAYMYPGAVGDWIAQEWQQQDLSMKTQRMEEAREAFGLLIVAAVLGLAALIGWRENGQKQKNLHLIKKKSHKIYRGK
ncbi:transmembrane 220 family protein [Nafulsella turpanensis]|uniref:transmembrane 220 family protein n=1 Tax=Nafulsella turpanensis TaxID=1265690 RepID=UPI0003477095|nr:transmembrane 220 family protein [Nafulsella turpanensis]